MRDLRRIRRYLSISDATSLANALISSRLDYCNSLLYGITDNNLKRLQVVQNSLCRIVKRVSKFEHITQYRKELHWLPIKFRIQFKINLLTYKAINFGKPLYLCNKLVLHQSTCSTRHIVKDTKKLLIPHKASNWGFSFFKRRFSVSAPTLWNELPISIRLAPSISVFRHDLKAHLFSLAYPVSIS